MNEFQGDGCVDPDASMRSWHREGMISRGFFSFPTFGVPFLHTTICLRCGLGLAALYYCLLRSFCSA